jgi:hypothetical protein
VARFQEDTSRMAEGDNSLTALLSAVTVIQPLDPGNPSTVLGDDGEGFPSSFRVRLHTRRLAEKEVAVEGLAPYHTLEDLHRALWVQTNKSSETYPKYSFLGIETEKGWFSITETFPFPLPNPREAIESPSGIPNLTTEDGERLPVLLIPRGRVLLEEFLISEGTSKPKFHLYSLDYLVGAYRGVKPIAVPEWNRRFWPYFPSLDPSETGVLTPKDVQVGTFIDSLIRTKIGQAALVQALLNDISLKTLSTSAVRLLSMQWLTPKQDLADAEGVDALFFSRTVSPQRPFMRLLMPNQTPLTKLYQERMKLPYVHDPLLLRKWSEERNPLPEESILYAKIPLRERPSPGYPQIYATLRVLDDRTADIVIQPPVGLKSLSVQTDLKDMAETIHGAIEDIIPKDSEPKLAQASFSVEYKFPSLPPKSIIPTVKRRLLSLSTIFQETAPIPEDVGRYFVTLRYKAVSNFRTPSTIESWISYTLARKGLGPESSMLVGMLAKEFGISTDESLEYIKDYIKKSTEVSTADDTRQDFLATNNPGVDIGIQTNVGTSFTIQVFNVRSIRTIDIQRLLSIIQLAFDPGYEYWDDEPATKADIAATAKAADVVTKEARALEQIEEADEAALEAEDEGDELYGAMPVRTGPARKEILPEEEAAEPTGTKVIAQQWYITQLQKLDKLLFTTGKDKNSYSKKCAGNEGRQPVGLTQEQFNTMIRLYSKTDPTTKRLDYVNRFGFVVYGEKPPTEFTEAKAHGKEKFYLLRYGSNPTNLMYMFCPELFCVRDMLPISDKEFEGEPSDFGYDKDYNNEPKPRNSCPFCHGTLIDEKLPKEGQTVLRRKPKLQDNKTHKYIGFLSKFTHPDGFGVPCCFISPKSIEYEKSPFYKHIRDRERVEEPAGDGRGRKESLKEPHQGRVQEQVAYGLLLSRLHREYVLGTEKWPLEAGKVGLPSLAIDGMFGQDSTQFVLRAAIKQEFKPSVHGLVRVGVLNRPQYASQSLLSALCPLLGFNSLSEVAKYIANRITPRVFLNLNFGNLVLEFYDPAKVQTLPANDSVFRSWTRGKLLSGEFSEYEVRRLFVSYRTFIQYVLDPNAPKLLRHFYHALAEPGLLTTNGLLLIPIQYRGNPSDPATKVEVQCPLLGYDAERYAENDIAFVTVSETGIWEPLLYVAGVNEKSSLSVEETGKYVLTQELLQQDTMLPGIKAQYQDFTTNCRSAYRGAYTFQSGVENRLVEPVSAVLDRCIKQSIPVSGIVRDSYNHLIALTVKRPSGEVLIPVVDDGYSFHDRLDVFIYLSVESVPKASAHDVEDIYTKLRTVLAQDNTLYTLLNFIQTPKGIVAFEIGDPRVARITLPCKTSAVDTSLKTPIRTVEGDTFEFEYMIDRKLQLSPTPGVETPPPSPLDSFVVSRDRMNEIYEHLRITFANYIATAENSRVREDVKTLVQKRDIPKFEKEQKLAVEFYPVLQKWFYTSPTVPSVQVLLRKDCVLEKDQSQCDAAKGICAWDESSNTCKIHTPKTVQIRSTPSQKTTDAVQYFARRLFDEIVRLPARANELLQNTVKRVRIPTTNIHVGDAWIIPENVPAWYELLRTGVSEEGREVPQYYEEFSRSNEDRSEAKAEGEVEHLIPLSDPSVPASVQQLIPSIFQKRLALKRVGSPDRATERSETRTNELLDFFGVSIELSSSSTRSFLPDELAALSKSIRLPIVQVTVENGVAKPLGVTYGPLHKELYPSVVTVLFPDLELGPSILIDTLDKKRAVPQLFVEGKIFDSLKYFAEQEKGREEKEVRQRAAQELAKAEAPKLRPLIVPRKRLVRPAEPAVPAVEQPAVPKLRPLTVPKTRPVPPPAPNA